MILNILHLIFVNLVFCDPIDDIFNAVKNDDADKLTSILLKEKDSLKTIINTRDDQSGETPLMMAILRGRTNIVKVLLGEESVDVTIPEIGGYTALHGAGYQGRPEIVKLLLDDKRNLDPNTKHSDGFSPLHRACWGHEKRHTDTVAVFIESGKVDWNQTTDDGKTCMEITKNPNTKKWLTNWSKEL